jgi:tight adherence protein B
MDQPIVIHVAVATAALAWPLARALIDLLAARKRKIRQRLAEEKRYGGESSPSRSVRLLDLQEKLPGLLGDVRPLQSLQKRISRAFPSLTLAQFAILSVLTGVIGGAIGWIFSGVPAFALLGAVGGALLPCLVVGRKLDHWKKTIVRQLPDALDFLSRVLRAGQSFSTGLQLLSEELPNPLAREFRRCYDQHGLGQPIEEGLREMAIRLESTDFAFFATAVILQRQSGGDLAEVLQNISHMVRQRLRLQQSVRAKTAEGRLTGYIMVLFPFVMFVLTYAMDPTRAGVLLHTMMGRLMLLAAATLQLTGLLLIRRITTVRV